MRKTGTGKAQRKLLDSTDAKVFQLDRIGGLQVEDMARILVAPDNDLTQKERVARSIVRRERNKTVPPRFSVKKMIKWFWQLMKCDKELLEYLNESKL